MSLIQFLNVLFSLASSPYAIAALGMTTYDRKHLYFRDTKKLSTSFWEWFCSREDFLRHSFTALLGGAELRMMQPISPPLSSVPVLAHTSYSWAKSCSIQHRRLTESDTLEERVECLG